jgi:hypothetical protein
MKLVQFLLTVVFAALSVQPVWSEEIPFKAGSVLIYENFAYGTNLAAPPQPSGEMLAFKLVEITPDRIRWETPAIKGINMGAPTTFKAGVSSVSFSAESQWLPVNKATAGTTRFLNPSLKVGDAWSGPHPNSSNKLEWKVEEETSFDLGGKSVRALRVKGTGDWFFNGNSGPLEQQYLYSPELQVVLEVQEAFFMRAPKEVTRGYKLVLKQIQ